MIAQNLNWPKLKFTHFRMDRGEIMLHTVTQDMALYKNRHHFSKETLANLHTSEIVPLGSPLVVGFMCT